MGDDVRGRVTRGLAGGLVVAAFGLALVAFGGRSLAWVVVLTALAAAVAALLLVAGDAAARPRASVVVPALALVVLAALGLPRLPARLVGALSPRRLAIATATPHDGGGLDRWLAAARGPAASVADALREGDGLPATAPAAAPVTAPAPLALSFDAPATALALAVLACWLALLLALSAQAESLGLRVLVAITALTAIMGVYAIVWAHFGNGRIYGVFEAPPNVGQQPFGPFWNPNHFAALLALTALPAASLVLAPGIAAWRRVSVGLVALVLYAGVVDARSRGGVIGAGAGLALLGAFLLLTKGRRLVGAALVALALGGLVVSFVVVPERVIEQSLTEAVEIGHRGSNFERSRIYRAELEIARDAPLVGIGLGAFRTAYPAFQVRPDPLVPLHGESDWMESLSEGGAPLLLAWLALAAALVAAPLRAIVAGRAPVPLAGLVAALGGVVVHAAVDFHLREPSVALVAIVVAATAHGWARRLEDRGEDTARPGRWRRAAVVLLAAAGMVLCLVKLRVVPWDRATRAAELAFARGEPEPSREAARKATQADPSRANSWALLAASEEQLARRGTPKEREAHRLAALDAAVEALRRNPAALGAARIAGQTLLAAGADEDALEAARLAVLVAPGHAAARRLLGQALLRLGRDDEALPHLAFAFDAIPGEQISAQAMPLARLVREAGHADAARIFGAMKGTDARIYYVHRLVQEGHGDELGAYLRVVLEEGVAADEADAWSYALVGGSPEAAELGRAILPHVKTPLGRARIGRALAAVGDEKGFALLSTVAAEPAVPAAALTMQVETLLAAGRKDDARAAVQHGLALYPTDVNLLSYAKTFGG